jgi:hypothetical protein
MENVQDNPNDNSREQLYDWLTGKNYTITDKGFIVGYKGVESDGGESYQSVSEGTAIVDGTVYTGKIPNYVGAVVEMPRNQVDDNSGEGCSTGLHVATYEYARSWGRNGAMLEVHINPRDVVSVPDEGNAWPKMRVCRYTVVNIINDPYEYAVLYGDEELCEECGSYYDECYCEDEYSFEEEEVEKVTAEFQTALAVTNAALESLHEPHIDYLQGVKVGDVYESTDSRRSGVFTVESFDGQHAVGTSRAARFDGKVEERQRKVNIGRLASHKYRKLN